MPKELGKISCNKYGTGIDTRIGWDTHIIRIKGYGVIGFTDGPPEDRRND